MFRPSFPISSLQQNARGLWFAVALVILSGCQMPQDPEKTLLKVQGGTLLVGVTESKPWVNLTGEEPAGLEIQLVEAFAKKLNAKIQWIPGAESDLLERLERRELDLVVGGLKDSTPWVNRVGLTRPYLTIGEEKHVMAVPTGENRWLLTLDQFLQEQKHTVWELYQREQSE